MDFDNETSRSELTVQGRAFTVPAPFEEGHVCSGGEAAALNQLLVENMRNNFASRIKAWESARDTALAEGKEFSDPEPNQSDLDEIVRGYQFGVRRTGERIVVDPVEKEALNLALAAVKEAIRNKGHKVSDFTSDQLKDYAAQAVATYPVYKERAQAVVDARKSAAGASLGGDLLASIGAAA